VSWVLEVGREALVWVEGGGVTECAGAFESLGAMYLRSFLSEPFRVDAELTEEVVLRDMWRDLWWVLAPRARRVA
jgi:hypothetical protein